MTPVHLRGDRLRNSAQTSKNFVVRLIAALSLVLLTATGGALADTARQSERGVYRDGVVLLAFRNGIQQSRQDAVLARVGAREIKRIGMNVRVVEVRHGRVPEVVQLLRARNEVRFAEPDYLQTLSAGSMPNDPSVGIQWAAQNTGQMVNGTAGTPGADQRTLAAWGITTGTNSVVIAELDTGVQYTHPDLITNMWNNPGGIGGCPAGTHGYNVLSLNCDPMDDDNIFGGHGTHVAGIMGAVGNNAAGVAGVNWTTSIMAVKWVSSKGLGATSDLISAMDWVVKAKQAGVNVRVVNDSQTYIGTTFSQALSDEIDLLGSNGILFVTASGNTAQNDDVNPRYPCNYKRSNMICVAASDQNDKLWTSANYGSNSVYLAAPGVNIFSTLRNSDYGVISGGSMAAPQVSATAALILSLGGMDVGSLKWMILLHTDGLQSLSGLVGTGGRLNVCKAVPGCSSAVAAKPTNSVSPVVTSIPQQGGLLGASTGIWKGIPSTYTYQWSRCDNSGLNCSPITGATGQTYAPLVAADALATVVVTVTASNSFGSTAAQSSASGAIATATSPAAISSSIVDGTSISGSVPWSVTPSRPEQFVQFYVDGVLTQTDSTSPYAFNASTTGSLDTTTLPNGPHVLGVRALFTDNRTYDFYGETVTVSNPPQNTGLPTISGSVFPGQTISTSNGVWNANTPPTSFSYQWERCDSNGLNCSIISGATNSTYALSGADSNFTIRSSVTGSNAGGSATAVSAQTAMVPAAPLAITTTSLPGGTQNAPYSATLTASGGAPPYSWSVVSGTLPTGLSLASNTGAISGTPTSFGTSNFTVRVTDTHSVTSTQALSLSVTAVSSPSVTTNSLPAGTQNTAYSATLAATGGTTPYTWSIASGTLPAGLSLAPSTGVISGTPTGTSTSNSTVRVTDANSMTATKALSITINGGGVAGGGIGLVQANSAQGSGVGSVSVPFLSSNSAGNLIIAFVRMSTATQTVTITDSAGNSYVEAVAHTQSVDASQVHLFYARNILGAASNTVIATFSATNSNPWLAIYEYKGLNTTNPLDQTAQAEGTGSAPSTGPTPTTTSPNELVFAGFEFSSSYWQAAGSGFTLGQFDTQTSPAANESMVVSSTGSYTATITLSSSPTWSGVVATFAAGALGVTTTSLPGGTQNAAYSATLAAVGGTTPYSWSITSGTLPTGLTLAPSTGVISGTPTVVGTSNFTVQVKDANSMTATASLSLTVVAPLSVTTTSLPGGTQNTAYTATLAATGGTTPYSWSVTSGALPTGLTLAPGTGVISGTPTVAGTSNFTVQVTDANSIIAAAPLSLTVSAISSPTVTTTSLPAGTQNTAYSATLAATAGTTPYSWSIPSGTLPAGLALAPSTGVISGTPTVAGTSNFTVQVTDANSMTATKALSLTVAASLNVTTTSLPAGTQNSAYSATLAATGGTTPYTWSIASGTLPTGLSLAPGTGVISGTPTGTGTSNFTVRVTDANSMTATQALSLTINSNSIAGGGIGLVQANSAQGSGVGAVSVPFLSSNSAGNLIIAFVRMSTATQTVTITDSAGNSYVEAVAHTQSVEASQVHLFYARNILGAASNTVIATFSATNSNPWLAIYEYKGLNTTNPLDQTAQAEGSGSAPSTGPTPTTTSPNELVFAGFEFSSSYWQAAGSGFTLLQYDTQTSPAANESMVVNSTGSYTATLALSSSPTWSAVVATFAGGGIGVTTNSLPNGTQNTAYSATLTAVGGTTPYSWSITSGTLPTGLTLAPSTGVISGTPTVVSTTNFTVQVTDATSLTATKALSLTVASPPTVTTTSLPGGTQNTAYTATLAATGGATPYSWSITSGTLPTGLTLAPSTGVISGTPTVAGTSNFTVQVTDASSATATKALSLTVAAPPPPTVTTTSLPAGTQNTAYSATLAATAGTTPYSWSIPSGTLPAGLALAPSTGVISGTPTVVGTSNFTAQVTDANSMTATNALSITVAASLNVTTTSLPAGTQNSAYSATLAATGGTTPYTWSIASGTLPAGLSLAPSTGVISGTPTGTGTSNFTVRVTDVNSANATKALGITIGGGGIGLVQANSAQGSGVGAVSVPFLSSNSAGNLIIAFVRMATASQTVTITDSAGNSYVEAVAHTQSVDASQVHLFYARNILGAASNTVIATFSAANSNPWLAIYEYKGLNNTNPLDRTAQAEGSGSAPSTGPTPTTTSPNELVFAGFGFSSSYWEAPGSGFTLLQYDTQTSPAANESMVVNSTGSYTATLALSSSPTWSAVVATFRQ